MVKGCFTLATEAVMPKISPEELEKTVIFIDPEKCMGCKSCELACAVEHSLSKTVYTAPMEKPLPKPRIKILIAEIFNVPMRCQHCKDAPCMNVCPTKALVRTDEGFVILTPEKCIGCLMCTLACPFGHPRYNRETKTIVKCDFCIDRVRAGKFPACVEACPTGALKYGKLEELLEEVAVEKAKQLISGMGVPGIVYVKPVTPAKAVPTPKPLDLYTKYTPVSWR